MTSFLLVTQIILTLIITVAVLLQKSSSIGLGVYSGSNESFFGAKGPAGFMAKFTMAVGLVFIVNTVALGYFYNKETSKSVMDSGVVQVESNDSGAPSAPNTGNAASGLDNFAAPSAPSPFESKDK